MNKSKEKFEIIISETGQTVFVHKSDTKKCLKSFHTCDYNGSLTTANDKAREYIKSLLNR